MCVRRVGHRETARHANEERVHAEEALDSEKARKRHDGHEVGSRLDYEVKVKPTSVAGNPPDARVRREHGRTVALLARACSARRALSESVLIVQKLEGVEEQWPRTSRLFETGHRPLAGLRGQCTAQVSQQPICGCASAVLDRR